MNIFSGPCDEGLDVFILLPPAPPPKKASRKWANFALSFTCSELRDTTQDDAMSFNLPEHGNIDLCAKIDTSQPGSKGVLHNISPNYSLENQLRVWC